MPSYLTVSEQRLNFSITLFMRFRRLAKPVFAFCLHPYVNVKELRRKRVVPLLLSNAISIETHRDNYISAGLRRYTAQNSLLWITCEQKTPIQRGFSGSRATGAQSSPAEGESMVLTGREDLSFTG